MGAAKPCPPLGSDGPLRVPTWESLSVDAVDAVVNFGADAKIKNTAVPLFQRDGTAAIYNLLARNRVAYLGDEVGMGKTFVALGVMGLVRLQNPDARIVVIAPRENIQRKWIRELENFTVKNWRARDLRFRSLQDTPARDPYACEGINEFVELSRERPNLDLFVRTTSFSVWTSKPAYQQEVRERLKKVIPWLTNSRLPVGDPAEFRRAFARVLNAGVPEIDLLVVDEGHNLKHGFSPEGSTRNVLLAGAFGHPELVDGESAPWYRRKVRRLLLLSATPFEHDYSDLFRQIDLFGLDDVMLRDAHGADPRSLQPLGDVEADAEARRALVERLLVRRVSGIEIAGKMHTRNMYRREWRRGGLTTFDEPLATADVKQRLVVALIQKKVAEAIGDPKFGRHFQIGMLTSFESFLESTTGKRSSDQEENLTPTFYGEQTDDRREQEGIDSHSIGKIVREHRKRFRDELPHPKVNATVAELERAFDTGEKVLVFVRRIASMDELKARLDARYNARLEERLRREFATERGLAERPELGRTLDEVIQRYEQLRLESIQSRGLGSDEPQRAMSPPAPVGEEVEDADDPVPEDDSGNIDTFFAWFFRGDGSRLPAEVRERMLTGSTLRKNRLGKPANPNSLLFEDDVVAWVLGAAGIGARARPSDVRGELLRVLGEMTGHSHERIVDGLRTRAWAWFHAFPERTKKDFPALRVFEAWQAAGLEALAKGRGRVALVAAATFKRFRERFESSPPARLPAIADGFGAIEAGIGVVTVPTLLAGRADLGNLLLPEERPTISGDDDVGIDDAYRRAYERREARRTLFSGQCRLGAPYVDLYVLAIATLGSLESGARAFDGQVAELAARFVDRLAAQQGQPGFHAFAELSETAALFDVIIEKNFEGVRSARHDALPRAIQQTLAAQAPVASSGKAGLVRSVRQFRMPGFPLVLVTTDVLREGEDLHTFCRKTVHYGITWTPSGMEQRVGRIDRIGGLLQRRCSGRAEALHSEEMIQVYYPFLPETVELLQINAVLHRMNEFVRLMHKNVPPARTESKSINTAQAFTAPLHDVAQILDPLVSAFSLDDRRAWLAGGEIPADVASPNFEPVGARFDGLWAETLRLLMPYFEDRPAGAFAKGGVLTGIGRDARRQPVTVTLRRSHANGSLVLRCASRVGVMRDSESEKVTLQAAERAAGVSIEAMPGSTRRETVLVLAAELQFEEVADSGAVRLAEMVRRVAVAADREQARRLDDDPDLEERE